MSLVSVPAPEGQVSGFLWFPQVRQGLKTFSNWPTYPQLYVKGELVGGLDIVKVSPVPPGAPESWGM